MSRRAHSSVTDRVPLDVRVELDEHFRRGMRIREAAEWLTERGYPTSKSAVGRYYLREVRPLERMFQRAEAFKAVLTEGGDRPATELHETASLMLADKYIELLSQLGDKDATTETLAELSKGLAALQSAAVRNEALKAQVRKRLGAAFDMVMEDLEESLADAAPQLLVQLKDTLASRRVELDA